MKKDIPTFILPAAGFGKRVGSPKAKELLPDPQTGAPLIDWSIEIALKCGGRVVVVSRKEKIELNEYILSLINKKYLIEIVLIDATRDWPESILMAQSHWGENNVVLLPDTRFDSADLPKQMANVLSEEISTCFAVFGPESFSSWGIIVSKGEGFFGCEKPRENKEKLGRRGAMAWGLFGFKKGAGEKLLKYLLVSTLENSWYHWPNKVLLFEVAGFIDLTRDKKIFNL